ncbi:hypothetical protein PgNI_10482 [Pyricularia grisea]|uniref:Uncharacterized protein n=1 Tax=Pyricularia grisea TaxID=148305 RepID=A0A6P8AYE3_PYRGI|nr:hypothetical protein PgNI_10482 [Pyricularia grisea]TLD07378.1 hypothetical protein PgNI_10482 [Pyricularia grisea]
MAGDELPPAEAAEAATLQAVANSILSVLEISPLALSDDKVRRVLAVLAATQREWTTAATLHQPEKLRAANEEIDSLGYILVEKRAAMNLLLCNVRRKQTWIDTLEGRVLDTEAVVESQRRCIEGLEDAVRDLRAVCDSVLFRLRWLPVKIANSRSSKLLVEPGVVEELLGRLPVLGPPSDHTPHQVLKRVVLERGLMLLAGTFHARNPCNNIKASVSDSQTKRWGKLIGLNKTM